MDYFDYESIACEAGIPTDALAQIVVAMQREFPRDPMMCELHVLRACMAVRDGHIKVNQLLETDLAARQ